jgi:signal transduction histidine kinase
MKDRLAADLLTMHSHRLPHLFGYLLILVFALRRRYDLLEGFHLNQMLLLLGLFTLLYASEEIISHRKRSYPNVYFALQLIIVQCLGMFKEFQDTWALLYIVLGFQVAGRYPLKKALVWFGLFTISLLVTLSVEFGAISGIGRALSYEIIGVLLISYDIQYSRHEEALAESQVLVEELREAHEKLKEHAAQAEKLAAIQQRNRMLQELYDSVGQKIFAIQLSAEATRLMLKKGPQNIVEQLENLQSQTQSALGQMRHLIDQWRPDQ